MQFFGRRHSPMIASGRTGDFGNPNADDRISAARLWIWISDHMRIRRRECRLVVRESVAGPRMSRRRPGRTAVCSGSRTADVGGGVAGVGVRREAVQTTGSRWWIRTGVSNNGHGRHFAVINAQIANTFSFGLPPKRVSALQNEIFTTKRNKEEESVGEKKIGNGASALSFTFVK